MVRSAKPSFADASGEEIIECEVGNFKGFAMGEVYVIEETQPPEPENKEIMDAEKSLEIQELDKAISRIASSYYQDQIDNLDAIPMEERKSLQKLLETEQTLLKSDTLRKKILEQINKNKTASRAVHEVLKDIISRWQRTDSEEFQRNAETYKKFRTMLLTVLSGKQLTSIAKTPSGQIPLVSSVPPGEVINMFNDGIPRITAMVNHIGQGTNTDHANVVAGSNGIMIIRIKPDEAKKIRSGDTIIIDGHHQTLILGPNKKTREYYADVIERQTKRDALLQKRSRENEDVITKDGTAIKISVNAESSSEIPRIHNKTESDINVSGIGLFRTEFLLYEGYTYRPNRLCNTDDDEAALLAEQAEWAKNLENEWFDYFCELCKLAGNKKLVVRTVDVEGDKKLKGRNISDDELEAIIETMIRAAVRAKNENPETDLRVMIPNVRGAEQFENYQAMREKACKDYNLPPMKLGAMVENPSFVESVKDVNPDFRSFGTNDLISWCLGYNRYDPEKQHIYDPTNRTFLKWIRGGTEQEGELSACGAIASDLRYCALLIGSGLKEISVGLANAPYIKELVRRIDAKKAKNLVNTMINTKCRSERLKLLDQFNKEELGYVPGKQFNVEPKNDEERKILSKLEGPET